MRQTVFRDLDRWYSGRIVNKTNGITFRRWLHQANPRLTALLCDICGEAVREDFERMAEFAERAEDFGVQAEVAAIRRANKVALARLIAETVAVSVDPDALFDVQIKRIHEYKRQLLNLLQTIAQYQAIKADPGRGWTPRVKIFAGKAAATYTEAKLIVRLAHDVADIVNNDAGLRGLLKVVFLPNYNVSLAEAIIPAADLSEQISTAGMEASGTGNMKLALNGSLTIGTLDGANIEICERVGAENIFIFGLKADEVRERKRAGLDASVYLEASPALRQAIAALAAGEFSPGAPDRYAGAVAALRHHDRFMVTADFEPYCAAQRNVEALWAAPRRWWAASIRNIAHMGWFSSDRAIREYAQDIWKVPIRFN
jgi:starch phosphorylase